ncbi:helix-turn-helix domain-containing protein [Allomesorhizobium camelthorni]|uniref:Cupin domain-containing protein n=1 Tax=Allomesorhizobium camelthorni TaxID=475069 RepID=A0A6G4WM20_9HYPH|nr:XRE family transcriptional regulator [Mesorhizobium camelthorni]NGO55674.1 cupin domain-containing protein [Mesorhizobium camelthorni]
MSQSIRQESFSEADDGSSTVSQRTTHPIIGSRVRDLRKAKAMTLQDVGRGTGLSVGYLSQLEREQAMPSIRALSIIARFLGVNINWFFPDPEDEAGAESAVIVRGNKRRALRFESGIRDELLSPSLAGQLELLLCTFEPGANSGNELYAHRGEEAGYVSKGQLEITIEEDVFLLHEGDSFHFDSSKPHRYRNPGVDRAVVVWAMTPPHY